MLYCRLLGWCTRRAGAGESRGVDEHAWERISCSDTGERGVMEGTRRWHGSKALKGPLLCCWNIKKVKSWQQWNRRGRGTGGQDNEEKEQERDLYLGKNSSSQFSSALWAGVSCCSAGLGTAQYWPVTHSLQFFAWTMTLELCSDQTIASHSPHRLGEKRGADRSKSELCSITLIVLNYTCASQITVRLFQEFFMCTAPQRCSRSSWGGGGWTYLQKHSTESGLFSGSSLPFDSWMCPVNSQSMHC